MSTFQLAAYEQRQYFDDSGDPLDGGFVYVQLSGTSTPATTYSNSTGTQNTYPIELDSAGRCIIYLDPAHAYKFSLTDALGNPVGNTIDPVNPVNGGSSGLGEIFSFGSQSASPITQTSYPSGATVDKLQPGTSVYRVDSATLSGVYRLQVTGVMTVAGTLTVALVDLDSGAPDTPLATCAMTSLTGAIIISDPITFGLPGVSRNYGIKTRVSANTGFLIGATLIRTA